MIQRDANLRLLSAKGFRVAASLPLARSEASLALRPLEEILGRALALRSLCYWVASDPRLVTSEAIKIRVARDHLERYLTPSELDILGLSRETAHETHVDTIGWRLENIWPLAWIFGFEPAPTLQGMIEDTIVGAMFAHLPKGDVTAASFLSRARVRGVEDVDAAEDLFYCAHNAARSAQLGHDTVPEGFDPMRDGGVIHERRHSLTWALSPGVAWDDTELST